MRLKSYGRWLACYRDPSSSHTCDNQAQVSSQSCPGGEPGLSEHLLKVAEPMSQEKLAVLKALGGQEGSDVDLSCSAGRRTSAGARRAQSGAEQQTPPTAARRTFPDCCRCGSSPR